MGRYQHSNIVRRSFWRRQSTWALLVFIILVACVLGFYFKNKHAEANPTYFPKTITKDQVGIAVYYPVNLPEGYSVSNYKVIKKDVLYYLVTSGKGDRFSITIQALPSSFDFISFKKKFLKPDDYATPVGTNTVGVVGTELVGSVQTVDNSWIILNSKSTDAIKDMETITRSLKKVEL
jgi:hypothetical protein